MMHTNIPVLFLHLCYEKRIDKETKQTNERLKLCIVVFFPLLYFFSIHLFLIEDTACVKVNKPIKTSLSVVAQPFVPFLET